MMKISANQIIVFNINNQPAIQHFFQKVNNIINFIQIQHLAHKIINS